MSSIRIDINPDQLFDNPIDGTIQAVDLQEGMELQIEIYEGIEGGPTRVEFAIIESVEKGDNWVGVNFLGLTPIEPLELIGDQWVIVY